MHLRCGTKYSACRTTATQIFLGRGKGLDLLPSTSLETVICEFQRDSKIEEASSLASCER